MSKKEAASKATPSKATGGGREARLRRHMKRHPTDTQSEKGFQGNPRKKPNQKLGWTLVAFREVPIDVRKNIAGKAQAVAFSHVLKNEKKISNMMRHKERPKQK